MPGDALELLGKWRELAADVAALRRESRVVRAKLQAAASALSALEEEGRRRGISFTTTETATGVEGELHGRSKTGARSHH